TRSRCRCLSRSGRAAHATCQNKANKYGAHIPLVWVVPTVSRTFTFGSGAPRELRQKQHWPVYLDEVLSSQVAPGKRVRRTLMKSGSRADEQTLHWSV